MVGLNVISRTRIYCPQISDLSNFINKSTKSIKALNRKKKLEEDIENAAHTKLAQGVKPTIGIE